ncbi:M15 family metallopeptidase [Eubacteriales bacterium OttesenSCG-928-A19]|nr:M15 family metallopeptidase [Eubacteriales bacterium OttesenSCG-928-A19]
MRRYRRFPLLSVLVTLALAGTVVYLTFLDVDVPRRALGQVGAAIARLGETLSLAVGSEGTGGGFQFLRPTPLSQGDQAGDGQDPSPQSGFIFTDPNGSAPDQREAATPLLVNASHPLADGYEPGELVLMRDYCDESVVYIKGSEIEGDRAAVDALMTMLRAAIEGGVGDWQISAGYRSVAYQQQLWDNRVYEYRQQGLSGSQAQTATAKYVAKPGTSEHHTGLAFDVTVPGESFPLTEQSRWLAANCWEYGFIIRYTEEKQPITGINAEPWHIRYVGQPHARNMRDSGQCLEEYLGAV